MAGSTHPTGTGGTPAAPGNNRITPPGAGTPSSGPSGSGGSTTPSASQSAYDIIAQQLANWGLSELNGEINQLMAKGITSDPNQLQLALENTQAWKTRFSGNEMLKKAGLAQLSVADYLATEKSYANLMKQYGLPTGFYDTTADFGQWIGNSVSPNELQQRVAAYADIAHREDPAIIQQLKSMGMSQADLLAYMMDPTRAEPLIQQKYQTTLIGAAALRAGVTSSNPQHLAQLGISEQQAIQGFGQIAQQAPTFERLGDIYHQNVAESDLEAAQFDSNGDAQRKLTQLASAERASFNGNSGVTQGSLARNPLGTY